MSDTSNENPLASIADTLATAARDHSRDPCDAWLYGIALGWGDALDEVALRHGWSEQDKVRLVRLRTIYEAMATLQFGSVECMHPYAMLVPRHGEPNTHECILCGMVLPQ